VQKAGWVALVVVASAAAYVSIPRPALVLLVGSAAAAVALGTAQYLGRRPAAKRLVWPGDAPPRPLAKSA
jgi:hypothetical protein